MSVFVIYFVVVLVCCIVGGFFSLSCSQRPRRFLLICFWGFVFVGFHNWCRVFAVLTIFWMLVFHHPSYYFKLEVFGFLFL